MYRCSTAPTFDDDFLIPLDHPQISEVDDASLLQLNEQIHIIVIKQDDEGRCSYIGGNSLEWRKVLKKGVIILAVELGGGIDIKVPRGVIEIRLELLPRPSPIPEQEITNQLSIERARDTQADREFYLYSKMWYDEYLEIRETHKTRYYSV
jgi:centrosomal protein CEP76